MFNSGNLETDCNMENLTKRIFHELQFKHPYLCDESSRDRDADGRKHVTKALEYIRDTLDVQCEDDLMNATMVLALNLEKEPWNDLKIVSLARQLYSRLILQQSGTTTAFHHLQNHPKQCTVINKLISSTLKPTTWQDHATVCSLYTWYCHQLTFPLLSEHLDILLPPSLNFIDSYDDELKVCGVKCLYHILNESGKTELRWYGRARVIFDAFQKLTYTKHEPLIAVLHPAIIKIVEVLQGDPAAEKSSCGVDGMYRQLLGDMYLEDKLVLRRCYAHCVRLYIGHMGPAVIKHLKHTMKILLNYLEHGCGDAELTRLTILEALQVLLATGRPRIQQYHVEITKALLRLVVDAAMLSIDTDSRAQLTTRVSDLLHVIQQDSSKGLFVSESLHLIADELPIQDKSGGNGKLILDIVHQILSSVKGIEMCQSL